VDMHSHCSICGELEGIKPNRLSSILHGAPNAILLESKSFAVIPSVGPLIAGHCLVVTKQHSSNVLYGLSPECHDELLDNLGILLSRLTSSDGARQLFCFEHGKKEQGGDDVLCSTSHGHLHVIPFINVDAAQVFGKLGSNGSYQMTCQSFIPKIGLLDNYIAAFVFEGCDNERSDGMALDATGLPSQYLRRLIGESLGTNEWDWKRFPRLEVVRETISKLCVKPKSEQGVFGKNATACEGSRPRAY
jgi:hypothetical protein